MTPPKPISCPFCGSENVSFDASWVVCFDCAGEGPVGDTRAEAIAKWNTRPVEAALREALKPFAEFAEQWDARPPGGLARSDTDAVYTIDLNPGAPSVAITLGHLRAAARVLKGTI